MIEPVIPEIKTTIKPMRSEIRDPYMIRLKISRPISSVPKKWAAPGGVSLSPRLRRMGSYGARTPAKRAIKAMEPMIRPPATADGLRLRMRTVSPSSLIQGA